jgi:hypothetical protein
MYAIINYTQLAAYNIHDVTFVEEGVKALLIDTIPKGYITKDIRITPEFNIVEIVKCDTEYEGNFRVTDNDAVNEYKKFLGKKIFGKELIFTKPTGIHPENRFYIYLHNYSTGTVLPDTARFVLPNGSERGLYQQWQKEPLALHDVNGLVMCQGDKNRLYLKGDMNMEFVTWCIENYEAKAKKRNTKNDTKKLEELFASNIKKKKQEIEDSIKQIEDQNIDMSKTIVENVRKSSRFAIALEAILRESETAVQKMEKELARALAHPDIREVMTEGQLIIFKTNKLLGKTKVSSSTTREVFYGRMTCVIDIGTSRVSMDNEDFLIETRCHPHHLGSGNMCLGTLGATLPDIIGKYEIYNAICLLVDFMKTAHYPDQAGARVIFWPYIEKGKLVLPGTGKVTQLFMNPNMKDGAEWESL